MRLLRYNSVLIFIRAVNIALRAQSAENVLSADEVIRLIPARIKGFGQRIDPKARQTRIGYDNVQFMRKEFQQWN